MFARVRWERVRGAGLGALAAALSAGPAHAVPISLPTNTGDQTFDSEQFADTVLTSRLGSFSFRFQGPFPADFNTLSAADAILGFDLSNGVGISKDDSITLGFSRPASLLAIWEAGDLSEVGVTELEASIDGGASFSRIVLFQPTPVLSDPQASGFRTNYQQLQASDFGLPSGALIDALRITARGPEAAFVHTDILAVAAVPEPASAGLLALGLAVLAHARRRRAAQSGSLRRGGRSR